LFEQLVQVAVHLVGREVVEAERFATFDRQRLPVGTGRFEQLIGADDVGLDKFCRAVDRAVDMGFGGQVHDGIRLEFQQRFTDTFAIGDIGLKELIAVAAVDFGQRLEIAGVGQLVQIEDAVPGVLDQMADQSRADESGSAGYENAHD